MTKVYRHEKESSGWRLDGFASVENKAVQIIQELARDNKDISVLKSWCAWKHKKLFFISPVPITSIVSSPAK